MKNSTKKNILIFSLITILIVVLDQVSKYIISICVDLNTSVEVIKKFIYLTYTHNTGAAFSILKNNTIFLIIISILVLAYLIKESYNYCKLNKRKILLCLSFVLGGLIGNLLDRIIFLYVRDFIDIKIFGYNYPIFNVADSFLVVGAFMLIYAVVKDERRDEDGNNNKRKSKKIR